MTPLDIDAWARKLSEAASRSTKERTNETELREDLDSVIREAAADLYGMSDRQITAERPASATGARRPYDKAYGGLVVEWEWDMGPARRLKGAQQALDYLYLMRSDLGADEAFSAVVSDGQSWGFLAADLPPQQLSLGESELPPDQRFQWRENSPAACRRFLVLLGSNLQSAVTAAGLAAAFGPNSGVAHKIVALLSEALAGRKVDDRADTLYREWRRSLEVVYGDLDDEDGRLAELLTVTYDLRPGRPLGELLFSVHTYFGMVVRLVAVEVLSISVEDEGARPTSWSSLDDAELSARLHAVDAGQIPEALQIQNLFEGDVFSWYLAALGGNLDLLNGVRELLDTLETFALPRVAYGANQATDVLRDLYLTLVPRALRNALGEFLTPVWLAEACLDRIRASGRPLDTERVLDPTCGTGTFLMPILRQRVARLRAKGGESVAAEDVRDMLNGVVGFDINPIAVTAARANYVTALGDLAAAGSLTLPVWRADSVLLPDEPAPQITGDRPGLVGHPWQALRTSLPDPFPVPPSLATAERMASLRECLERSFAEEERTLSSAVFADSLEAALGPQGEDPFVGSAGEWESVTQVALELHSQILELREADRNGVWARIIENSFAPLFAGDFDVVVGNPPWLTWTKTPEQWREVAAAVWKRYGLWRVPKEPGTRSTPVASGDMAVLVFASALHRYARPGGAVGMLAPRSLINADPAGRAFRQFHLKPAPDDQAEFGGVDLPFAIKCADDWSEVRPFSPEAANVPVFLLAESGAAQTFPVDTVRWHRAGPRAQLGPDWASTRPQLRLEPGSSAPIDASAPTSAWSYQADGAPPLLEGGTNRWSFGKGLDTRGANGVFFVEVLDARHPSGEVLIANDPKAGRNKLVQRRQGWVEDELVRPLLRGRDVSQWSARPSTYIVAPYKPADPATLLTQPEFRRDFPKAWRWLRVHAEVLQNRSTPPTRKWDVEGDDWCRLDGPFDHMTGANLVVVREQQKRPAAAVLSPEHDSSLGRTGMPLIDHKLIFCAVDSPDEAVYLATFINSTPIQDLIASYANEIAISPQTLARLPIPDFNLAEEFGVVDAGRAAAAAVRKGDPIDQQQIDGAVIAALGLESYATPDTPEPVSEGNSAHVQSSLGL